MNHHRSNNRSPARTVIARTVRPRVHDRRGRPARRRSAAHYDGGGHAHTFAPCTDSAFRLDKPCVRFAQEALKPLLELDFRRRARALGAGRLSLCFDGCPTTFVYLGVFCATLIKTAPVTNGAPCETPRCTESMLFATWNAWAAKSSFPPAFAFPDRLMGGMTVPVDGWWTIMLDDRPTATEARAVLTHELRPRGSVRRAGQIGGWAAGGRARRPLSADEHEVNVGGWRARLIPARRSWPRS